jgi:F0F1-type ATP synthase assembly protein I
MALMAVSLLGGYGLDHLFQTEKPWFMIIFGVLGIISVLVYIVRSFQ